MVESRRFGKTDIEMTPIALGCAQMAVTGMTSRVCPTREPEAVVQAALSGGVNWFDTAEGYGHGESERALTTGLRAACVRLGEVLIATRWLPVGRRSAGIARTIGDHIGALQFRLTRRSSDAWASFPVNGPRLVTNSPPPGTRTCAPQPSDQMWAFVR
jgi:aryl-alcohol dehydrogenase-like predicted oxidoreductase